MLLQYYVHKLNRIYIYKILFTVIHYYMSVHFDIYNILHTHTQMNGTLLATNNVTGISSTATSATITNLSSADFHEIEVMLKCMTLSI